MRALLKAHADKSRKVWVLDSFEGVPGTDQQHHWWKDNAESVSRLDQYYLVDDVRAWGGNVTENWDFDGSGRKSRHALKVSEEMVRNNFERFGLLDDQVEFVKGYFNETLPSIQERGLTKIAVLRVDADLYLSTRDVLENLYPLVEPGGWVILDDWPLPNSHQATVDYLRTQGVDANQIVQSSPRITPEYDVPDPPRKYAGL